MNPKFFAPLGLLAASVAYGQTEVQHLEFGPEAGIYYPTGSAIKDVFGSTLHFSLTPTSSEIPEELKWLPSFDVISMRKNGSSMFLVPVTASYVINLQKDPNAVFRPYLKFLAGGAYYDYAVTVAAGDRRSKKTFGYTGGVELGAKISKLITMTATYHYFSKSDKLDFSGLSLGIQFNLFKL